MVHYILDDARCIEKWFKIFDISHRSVRIEAKIKVAQGDKVTKHARWQCGQHHFVAKIEGAQRTHAEERISEQVRKCDRERLFFLIKLFPSKHTRRSRQQIPNPASPVIVVEFNKPLGPSL